MRTILDMVQLTRFDCIIGAATQMRQAGAPTIAQDEASSVVWGMPGAIAQAGLCHAIAPLPELARKIRALLEGRLT